MAVAVKIADIGIAAVMYFLVLVAADGRKCTVLVRKRKVSHELDVGASVPAVIGAVELADPAKEIKIAPVSSVPYL